MTTSAEAFDAPSFYSLFWNDKGIKCKINIPDTVLFRFGQLSAWWGTTKDGYVQRHTSQSTSIEAIRRQFINFAKQDEANYSQFVAISRLGNGKPQLLRLTAFNQLCEILSDRLESGSMDTAPEIETPSMLQAFVQPYEDLRYITTYVNSGTAVTCHTFQRKFSKRYTAMSAASAAQPDTRDADVIAALNPETSDQHNDAQGVVEPALKMHLRKTTSHIVNYIQRAHGLVLGALVVEHVRNLDGKVFLLSVLRTEWLSNALGHGAGLAGSHGLTLIPQDIDDYDVEGLMAAKPGNAVDGGPEPEPLLGDHQLYQQQGTEQLITQQQVGESLYQLQQGGQQGGGEEGGEVLIRAPSLGEGLHEQAQVEAASREGFGFQQDHQQNQPELDAEQQASPPWADQEPQSPGEYHIGMEVYAQPNTPHDTHTVSPTSSPRGTHSERMSAPASSTAGVGAWADDARTAYIGSPASAQDAAAVRPREGGGTGPYKVRPMSAAPASSHGHAHSAHSTHSTPGTAWQQPGTGGGRVQGGGGSSRLGTSHTVVSHTQRPASAAAAPSTWAAKPHAAPQPGGAQERSALACFPGGQQRVSQMPHPVTNTWPSLQHEVLLRPNSAAAATTRPTSGAHSTRGSPPPASPMSPQSSGTMPQHFFVDARRASVPRPSSSPPAHLSHRAMSARNSGTPPTANPGGAPRGFLSTTHRSSHTSPSRPYSARGVSAMPSEFAPVPGGVTPPPVGALTLRGDHVNGPQRGVPLLVSGMQKEVETLRDQLIAQNELAEANAAKVRQLEHEKEITVGTFDTRNCELMHLLACTRDDLSATRTVLEQTRLRAEMAEARADELDRQVRELTGTVQSERATTLSALREYQEKEASSTVRAEQLEAEVLRMSSALKMEITAVNSLKRQLLEFSEIAENHKASIRDSQFEIGMIEVMDRIKHLFAGQTNPAGEQYAVQKILNTFHSQLRAVFLFYTQLEATFTHHWPPHQTFAQWMMFCKDSETSDIRSGGRGRGRQLNAMLQPSECEALFNQYAKPDPTATHRPNEPVLQYEAFLAAIVHAATKLRRPDVPYVSEALREYLLTYLNRAHKVEAAGLKKGALRAALEGTRKGKQHHTPSRGTPEPHKNGTLGMEGDLASAAAAGSGGGSRPMSGRSDRSGVGAGGPGSDFSGSGRGSKSRPLSGRPMWRNPNANSRPASPGSPGSSSSPVRGARLLHDVGSSAVFQELAALSGLPQGNDVVRAGGGFI